MKTFVGLDISQKTSSCVIDHTGNKIRMVNVVDDFNREALAIEIDLNIPAQCVVRVLDRIVANRRYPLKMRMDNGPELISLALVQWAEEHGAMLEFIKPGKPTQNAFIERFNQTYRTEILDFICSEH
ncbi:integrase core domain protein [Yersinia ruckeri]|nr:integrase core domain protein [Yersinia ruckeri]